jgi:5-hydroxyisourate hydrolase
MRLSVQVVDCAFGVAAANVQVRLRHRVDAGWRGVATGRTGLDGKLRDWHGDSLPGGTYQLEADLDGYYTDLGVVPFNPRAIVEFRVPDPALDLEIPLLVTANSYFVYKSA